MAGTTHLTGLLTSQRSTNRTLQRSHKRANRLLHKCPPKALEKGPRGRQPHVFAHIYCVCQAFILPCCRVAAGLLRYYRACRGTTDLLALLCTDGSSWKSCPTWAACVGCSCRLMLPLGTKALEKRCASMESARWDEEAEMARDRDSLQKQQGEMSHPH